MMKKLGMVAVVATLVGCGNEVCGQADEISAGCLSSSAPMTVDDDVDCSNGSLAACEAQCIIDLGSDYCPIALGTAEQAVVDTYESCVAECATIPTESETEMPTEET